MCLAMVYTDKAEPENLVLSNVQRIDCKDGMVYLTDLLDRQVVVEGEIVSVDLVGNTTIIRTPMTTAATSTPAPLAPDARTPSRS